MGFGFVDQLAGFGLPATVADARFAKPLDVNCGHSVCMYTMSNDGHFLIDRKEDDPRIVFATGLSGHGFKFTPVIGRYLVQLLQGQADKRFEFLRCGRLG